MSETVYKPMTIDDVPYLDEAIGTALFGERQTSCSAADYDKIARVRMAITDAGFRLYVEYTTIPPAGDGAGE